MHIADVKIFQTHLPATKGNYKNKKELSQE